MSAFKPFKIPSRKGAIPIIDPTSGIEVNTLQNGAQSDPSRLLGAQDIAPTFSKPPQGVVEDQVIINHDKHKDRKEQSQTVIDSGPINSLHNHSPRSTSFDDLEQYVSNLQILEEDGNHGGQTFSSQHLLKAGWKPDINASAYIPSYLWAIQQSPSMDRFSQQINSIDFKSYIQKFAGSNYLEPVLQIQPEISDVQVTISRHPKNLSLNNYLEYFSECLKLEASSHSAILLPLVLFNTTLESADAQQHLYRLRIPGLKDNTPILNLGDVVIVRQIFPFSQIAQQGLEWLSENQYGQNGSIAPGFNGIQIYSYVWGISKTTETVVLRVDGFFATSKFCNVSFTVQADLYVALGRAIRKVNNDLMVQSMDSTDNLDGEDPIWTKRMLFPDERHCVTQKTLHKGTFDRKWIDLQLNYEQQKAVDSIVSRNYGNVPFLISGVPGSGKTKTVVECALQLLQSTSEIVPHLLLCAPSNPAADTLAIRLSSRLKPHELFRLNGWNRTFAEVPSQLLPYTYTENEIFSLPPFETTMKYKIIVTTCADADMLVQARLSNQDLMELAFGTISAVSPGLQVSMEKLIHWTALIVDEAAQATEPSVCIPMTVVSTPPTSITKPGKKTMLPLFVMAGDEHQLAPRVYNSDTALSVSLFQRLFMRPIYANHPLSRRNIGPYKKLTKSMLPILRPPFINLTRNYRSHPAILAMPSVLFYSDTLIPTATPPHAQGPIPTWPEWRNRRRWPLLFNCNASQDQVEDILTYGPGTGVYNDTEAKIALRYTQSLLEHASTIDYLSYSKFPVSDPPPKPISQHEIAVITPFLAQVTHLRKLFRSHNLYDVNIGPLEAFQGLESRFLIICTTRTRSDQKFLETDQSRALGLVGERQRFNMAITRAKEGVIIIGNPNVLVGTGKDETWRAFLGFCARNGCWTVEQQADQSTKSTSEYWFRMLGGRDKNTFGLSWNFDISNIGYMSRLEKALLHSDSLAQMDDVDSDEGLAGKSKTRHRKLGAIREEEDYDSAMWTAGLAAEEVLRGALDDDYTG
ncbi:hypothetical protein LOZ53_002770 [Ophidiomyces ophidiicola]|nr:hypothetical protein LOZ55_005008 [Ophidiomyces ophidiicola]KAI1978244.1 hypothetical protein LOZ54_006337 [Ophidiomyces ophidiicola]KAI1986771.1 hypothetical protein LOZ51_005932 [Ophidiomyces ophidiicola]KAI1991697.1 hypothetical protein LOZ53_002770 [Ophidiomyces ophidiicola]